MAKTEYIIMRSHEFIFEDEGESLDLSGLNDDQKKMLKRVVKRGKEQPSILNELFKTISKKFEDNEGNIQDRIEQAVKPENTDPERDQEYAEGFTEAFARIIDDTEGSMQEKLKFANTLGQKEYINTENLMSPSASWDDWLPKNEFVVNLFENMFNDGAFRKANKGPGEVALALLNPKIVLTGKKGDITIGDTPVEVKGGETTAGGRLQPTTDADLNNVYGDSNFWINKVFPEDEETAMKASQTTASFNEFPKKVIEAFKLDAEQVETILKQVFANYQTQTEISQLIKEKGPNVGPNDLKKLAVKNYAYSQGDYNFLILTRSGRKSVYFEVDNIDSYLDKLSISGHIMSPRGREAAAPQVGALKGKK